MELVKRDGRLISGLPCIYHLGLATLYSEQVKEDGDSYIFDPEKTVYLVFDRPNAEGKQAFAYRRLREGDIS